MAEMHEEVKKILKETENATLVDHAKVVKDDQTFSGIYVVRLVKYNAIGGEDNAWVRWRSNTNWTEMVEAEYDPRTKELVKVSWGSGGFNKTTPIQRAKAMKAIMADVLEIAHNGL